MSINKVVTPNQSFAAIMKFLMTGDLVPAFALSNLETAVLLPAIKGGVPLGVLTGILSRYAERLPALKSPEELIPFNLTKGIEKYYDELMFFEQGGQHYQQPIARAVYASLLHDWMEPRETERCILTGRAVTVVPSLQFAEGANSKQALSTYFGPVCVRFWQIHEIRPKQIKAYDKSDVPRYFLPIHFLQAHGSFWSEYQTEPATSEELAQYTEKDVELVRTGICEKGNDVKANKIQQGPCN